MRPYEAGLPSPIARMQKLSVGGVEMDLDLDFAFHCTPSCLTMQGVKPVYQLGFIHCYRVLPARGFHPGPGFLMHPTPGLLPPPCSRGLTGSARITSFCIRFWFFFSREGSKTALLFLIKRKVLHIYGKKLKNRKEGQRKEIIHNHTHTKLLLTSMWLQNSHKYTHASPQTESYYTYFLACFVHKTSWTASDLLHLKWLLSIQLYRNYSTKFLMFSGILFVCLPQLLILVCKSGHIHDYSLRLNSKLGNCWVSGYACYQFWYMLRNCLPESFFLLTPAWGLASSTEECQVPDHLADTGCIFWFITLTLSERLSQSRNQNQSQTNNKPRKQKPEH